MNILPFLDLSTSGLTASADVDYHTKQHNPVTLEAGQSKTIYIDIIDDGEVESNETFLVEISGAAVGIGIKVIEVTIVDDDGRFFQLMIIM